MGWIFGVQSKELANSLMRSIIGSVNEKTETNEPNGFLAFVHEFKPRDATEAMLATQMGMVHIAMTRASRKLALATYTQQIEAFDRALNRLARTCTEVVL